MNSATDSPKITKNADERHNEPTKTYLNELREFKKFMPPVFKFKSKLSTNSVKALYHEKDMILFVDSEWNYVVLNRQSPPNIIFEGKMLHETTEGFHLLNNFNGV